MNDLFPNFLHSIALLRTDVLQEPQQMRMQDPDINAPLTDEWTAMTVQPRAIGGGRVVVQSVNDVTRIADLRQSGCLRLVFPETHRPDVEAVIVNTAGGLTGGDLIEISARAQPGSALTMTTQAAERAYRAQPGEIARVRTHIDVRPAARLNWLPQELILFDRSALDRRLAIDLADDARLLMVEPMVFGRAAMGELLSEVSFNDRIRVSRGGQPLYLDGMSLSADVTSHLARPAIASGAGAMASMVYVAPDAAAQLDQVRALLPDTAGASLLRSDMVVLRLLAADGFEMRRSLIPILDLLSQNTLPTSWRL